MEFVLHILNKHLTNERGWLRKEYLGGMDAKYKASAMMAKKRIPQLERAIEILGAVKTVAVASAPPPTPVPLPRREKKQMDLFKIFNQ